ncbi:Inulosucrase [Lacticaseibacillus thailandensis DSM 22698 = JCM 13996]|uniref:Inulosucrase n=1 Tax=Lacticaseibacillus thailandensis DSM 22698 = JCM 13996 TaxID=1423810 RepID=A0A0R2C8X1_9LACO|nr:Inulosucrase [Lacticaseibacillus thailandensis DSM 22698 = JCM 13996]
MVLVSAVVLGVIAGGNISTTHASTVSTTEQSQTGSAASQNTTSATGASSTSAASNAQTTATSSATSSDAQRRSVDANTQEASSAGNAASTQKLNAVSSAATTATVAPASSTASSAGVGSNISQPSSAAIHVVTVNGDASSVSAAQSAAMQEYIATKTPQKIVAVSSTIPQPTFSSSAKQQNYIVSVEEGALAGWYEHKVLPSITVAQSILESGWGGSTLSERAHNMFGIKADSSWHGATYAIATNEVINGRTVTVNAKFRAYSSITASFEDHGAFISGNSRYANIIGNKDYRSVANDLHSDGYATDPTYAGKLIQLIDEYHLTILDNIAFGGDTISGHAVASNIHYDAVKSNVAVNYGGQIVEGSRNDGLYKSGPYYTSSSTQATATVSARTLNGKYVRVLRRAQTARAWWVEIQLNSGETWWVDRRAVQQVSDTKMFDAVTNKQSVNYGAYIHEGGRYDGLYASGPYTTSTSTFLYATKHADSINNQAVTVIAEATTSKANWVQIRLASGATWWVDKRAIATYDQITNGHVLNANVFVDQNHRNDGLYATGPYHTSAQTIIPATKTAKQYNDQGATAIAEATTVLGTWVKVRFNDGATWWMDSRGVGFLDSIISQKSDSGFVKIVQDVRNDGLYATGPYMTSTATYTTAWKTARLYNGQGARLLGEAVTKRATWIHVRMNDGSTWWMDQRGAVSYPYDPILSLKSVSYTAQIVQDSRNDGLYQTGPYMTSESTYLTAAKTAKQYNGQQVQVIAEAVTKRATWVQIKLNNGTTWWMDKCGVLAFDTVTNEQPQSYQVTVQQHDRNDGLYQTAPYFTSVATKIPAVKTAKQYDEQTATVLKTADTIRTKWVYVQFVDGSRWWIDARGVV